MKTGMACPSNVDAGVMPARCWLDAAVAPLDWTAGTLTRTLSLDGAAHVALVSGMAVSSACRQRSRCVVMQSPALTSGRADRLFALFNAIVSTAGISFIAFILLRSDASTGGMDLSFMPAVNATLNAMAAICLTAGWVAIRRGSMQVHRLLMVAAFVLSAVFLVGYLSYHYVHGDTKYTGTGVMRGVYFSVLISHIVLSVTVLPLALTSF
jgi:putative membrane protein